MRTLLTSACVAAAAAAVLLAAPSAYADAPGGNGTLRTAARSSAPQPSRRPSADRGGAGLAETGSRTPVGALVAAAALLLGAGVYLTLRHRESRTRRH